MTRKSSGFNCKLNVIGIMAINTPRPIWISGTETKGTNRLSKLEIKMATSNAKTYKNISNMYRPLSFFSYIIMKQNKLSRKYKTALFLCIHLTCKEIKLHIRLIFFFFFIFINLII